MDLLKLPRSVRLLVLGSVLAFAPTVGFAAEFENDLERHVLREMELNGIPGLSLAVVRSGGLVYGRGFGVRDLAGAEPMGLDTPVELASLSKSLTALAVLLLAGEGRIDLDSPVRRYLPDFQPSSRHGSSLVTVRNLLEHKSGLTRQADRLLPCCGEAGDQDLRLAVRRVTKARLSCRPGTCFQYANSNYILLASIIETASEQTFPALMRERLFQPLEMTRTTFDLSQAKEWGLAHLHERIWGRVQPSPSRYRGWLGSSAVKATARDLTRYLMALMDETHPLGNLFSSLQLCAPTGGYRFGWRIQSKGQGEPCRLLHTGKIWGANTAVILVPEEDLAVVVLINSGIKRAEEIGAAAIAYSRGRKPPPPAAMAWSTVPDNWAILFVFASALILFCGAGYSWRAVAGIRSGKRRFFRGLGGLAVGRSALLALMATALLYGVWGQEAWSRPSLPSSAQTAFPLFGMSVGLLMLQAAIFGLAPRRFSLDDTEPSVARTGSATLA